MGIGHHGEVRPMHHGTQESVGGAPAPAALLVHLEVGAAEVVAAVEGADRRDAAFRRRVAPGVDDFPAHTRVLDAHFAASAVAIGGAAFVIFEGFEYWKNVVPRPAAVAERGPVVPVL